MVIMTVFEAEENCSIQFRATEMWCNGSIPCFEHG